LLKKSIPFFLFFLRNVQNEDLKLKLNFVKKSLEKNLKANQELHKLSDSLESKLKVLEGEHLACKEESVVIENNENHVAAITNFQDRLKEQDDWVKVLNDENSILKQKHDDVIDELLMKNKEIDKLEIEKRNTSLQNSKRKFIY
jgi:hypothetical protein